jgi:hypothetical protein
MVVGPELWVFSYCVAAPFVATAACAVHYMREAQQELRRLKEEDDRIGQALIREARAQIYCEACNGPCCRAVSWR